jgi:hypothetical protein
LERVSHFCLWLVSDLHFLIYGLLNSLDFRHALPCLAYLLQ